MTAYASLSLDAFLAKYMSVAINLDNHVKIRRNTL
jgi:hypothetical protein